LVADLEPQVLLVVLALLVVPRWGVALAHLLRLETWVRELRLASGHTLAALRLARWLVGQLVLEQKLRRML
jgi:hypothetical protein